MSAPESPCLKHAPAPAQGAASEGPELAPGTWLTLWPAPLCFLKGTPSPLRFAHPLEDLDTNVAAAALPSTGRGRSGRVRRMRCLMGLFALAAVLIVPGCGEPELTCADPIQLIPGSLTVEATVDETDPDAQATFVASISYSVGCDLVSETIIARDGAVIASDQETVLFELTAELAQGGVVVEPAECPSLTHGAIAVSLNGPTNEELFTVCSSSVWIEVNLAREGCEADGVVQRMSSQAFVRCVDAGG